jgi:hypothetical protein
MPNWTNNGVTLTHKDPAMIERAHQALARGQLLQEFIPCPQDLIDTVSGFLGDGDEQKALEAKQAANLAKYGYSTWYDFCVNEWGTKWDVGGDDGLIQKLDDNTLQASFDSAWAPPTTAYERLIELGFHIKAYYNEPGMCFCGLWEGDTENGFFDDYCDYSGETSKTVRECVGEELDDYFGLSDMMAEYEDEETDAE